MRTFFGLGLSALLASGVAMAQHVPQAAADSTATFKAAPPVDFDLFRGHRVFFDGSINGTGTAMMLDSGASGTVLDDDFAAKLGLTSGEKISVRGAAAPVPGRMERGVTMTIGGMTLRNTDVMVIDLDPVARAIGRPIPVVVGRDALKASLVTIDFPARTIAFADRTKTVAPSGAIRIPLADGEHLRTVPVAIGGDQVIQATLDIGNGGSVILSKSYWEAKPALAKLRYAETQMGGVGGIKMARRVLLPEVHFAGQRLANVPAILNTDADALPKDGANIGIEMLKPFVVTLDDSGGALYLRSTGASHAFARERAGIRSELAGDRLKIAYVSPDGPGAAAGLRVGDEIVAIDGRSIGPDYYDRDEWTRGPAGSSVVLARADGSRVTVKLRDYY